jgi:hypothetical protein
LALDLEARRIPGLLEESLTMVVIRLGPERLELQAPYHPVPPFRSKQIGGRWLGPEIGWAFPLNEEPALRALCLDLWAVDGSPASGRETVEVQIAVDERAPIRSVFIAYESPIYLVGREIAASLKNQRGARPGRGVRFLSGRPRCFATSTTWMTTIPNGSVFVIRDVPTGAVGRLQEAVGGAGVVEVGHQRQQRVRPSSWLKGS